MSSKTPVLKADKRERLGSRYSQRLREQGGLPAIVYGHKATPVPVTLDSHSALTMIYKGEKVFKLEVDGESSDQVVLLKDVQFDYLGTDIIHCDFARVDLNERINTKVSINLLGEAVGMSAAGAVLMHPTMEIEIECLVTELPDKLDVDITNLELGSALSAGDVNLPSESMKLITDTNAIVAQIIISGAAKSSEAEEVEGDEAATPEVIAEKKAEGEGKEG